jgi:hypothetical protein
VAAHSFHINEVPAGLLGIALPRRILGSIGDGTAVALGRDGELSRVVPAKDMTGLIALQDRPPSACAKNAQAGGRKLSAVRE